MENTFLILVQINLLVCISMNVFWFFLQIMKENQDTSKPMSEIYGAVHLLRLFGKNSNYVFHL